MAFNSNGTLYGVNVNLNYLNTGTDLVTNTPCSEKNKSGAK
jgi:hypothetical protein